VYANSVQAIFSDAYTLTDRKIGSGGFGQVYMAVNKFNNRQVACKIVPLTKIKEKYSTIEASRYKFLDFHKPRPASKVNQKTEMLKMLSWKRRTQAAVDLTEKLRTYDREVEILKMLSHVSLTHRTEVEE
jgi:serine/threonine protein kinase